MKTTYALALLSCVTLAACATPDGGYYDANGNYIPTDTPHNIRADSHTPLPGGPREYHSNRGYHGSRYDLAGYYDYKGVYIDRETDLNAPDSMLPPQDMCRVWFPQRVNSQQPAIEPCDGIKRVPAGAYVIFGG